MKRLKGRQRRAGCPGAALGIAASLIGGGMLATQAALAQDSADSDGGALQLSTQLGGAREPGATTGKARAAGRSTASKLPATTLRLSRALWMPMTGPGGPAEGSESPGRGGAGSGVPPLEKEGQGGFAAGPRGRGSQIPPGRPLSKGGESEPESPLPFSEVAAAPVTRNQRQAERKVEEELPDLSGEGWKLAPIRWGGNTTSTLSLFQDGDGGRTLSNTQAAHLRTASYIYQPWFAQVNANVGLLSGTTTRSTGGQSVGSGGDTTSTALTYGGSLNLFPLSRFPLQAYVDHSDSRASASSIGSQYTASRFGLRQTYRPLVGTENYSASYDRSVLASEAGNSTVDALQGSYSVSLDEHSVSASTRFSRNSGGLNGESSQLFGLTGFHNWRVDEDLSVSTSATFSDQQIRYLSSGILSLNNNRLMQASSSASWIPDEDLPLTVTGGANFLNMETQTDATSNQLMNLGGFLGLTYRFSSRLTGSGNFQLVQTQSGTTRQVMAAGTGALSYSGEPLTFGNYNYNWTTGVTATSQMILGGLSAQGVSGQVGHTLSRSIVFSEANVVSLNASQSVSAGTHSQTGGTSTLVHSGGASWRLGYSDRVTGLFSAVLADNLSSGQYSSHFRTFNLNGNGLAQISRRASFTTNANLAWSQQQQRQPDQFQNLQLGGQTFDNNTSQWTGAGSIGYNHRSPFDITNLNYSLTLQFTSSQTNLRIINGDPNASGWQVSKALQQRLEYRTGRLSFQLLNAFATVNGKKNASVYLQVGREFGGL